MSIVSINNRKQQMKSLNDHKITVNSDSMIVYNKYLLPSLTLKGANR